MSMRGHSDQIAILPLGACSYLFGRIAAGKYRLGLKAIGLERVSDPLDVLTIALHLLGLAEIELIDVARRPPVGDVDQHDRRVVVARACELPNVSENHVVIYRVLYGY